jgi:hypothetical protein
VSGGTVTVGTPSKQETYGINGTMETVGDALGKFFDGGQDPFKDQSVSLNSRELTTEDTDQPLRNSDIILVMSKRLASGGVKGA